MTELDSNPLSLHTKEAPSPSPERAPEAEQLPEFQIPPDLAERYQQNIVALAERTTRWDPVEHRFVLREDAPHLLVVPLRSGPIVKTGYDAYCEKHGIPQPPSLVVTGVGSETRDLFVEAMQHQNPMFDTDDDWESDDGQGKFRGWIVAGGSKAALQAIADIRTAVQGLSLDSIEAVRFLFVDDAGGLYRDVRDRITPAILSAALGRRPYQYEYHLLLPQKQGYPDEPPWQELIIRHTFGRSLPLAQREFLNEAVRGAFDHLHGRDDVRKEYTARLAERPDGNHVLETQADLEILAEILIRNERDFLRRVYPGRVAEDGFQPLINKYGANLLQLKDKLEVALIRAGKSALLPPKGNN